MTILASVVQSFPALSSPVHSFSVHDITDRILTLPPALAYTVIALLVFGEAAVFIGFVLPGETAVVLGGVLASRGSIDITTLVLLVVISAIIGDSVGYEVGRHAGERVLGWRPLRAHRERLDGARDFLRRKGGLAVLLGRWVAFLRAVMPGLAGVSRMRYPVFFVWNAIGGALWGTTFCLVGYLAGNSYAALERTIGQFSAVIAAVLVVGGLVFWRVRSHRREASGSASSAAGDASSATAQSPTAAQGSSGDGRDSGQPSASRPA